MREIKFRAWDYEKMTTDLSILYLYKYRGGWDRIEIMQYTGLKDKEGKEIYEGDILKNKNGKFLIEYYPSCFVATKIPQKYGHPVSLLEAKIIGNKYENPELLGGE